MATSTSVPSLRLDGPVKVTGTARYAADYAAPDLAHGVIVGSTVAAGRIVAIDTTAAEAFPGVIAVVTHVNRPAAGHLWLRYKDTVAPPGRPYRPLHDDRIRFSGQPVALVVAETWEAARDAASLVRVRYEAQAFDTDLERAREDSYEPRVPRLGVSGPPKLRGVAETAYTEGAHRISAVYRTSPEYHNAMELFATTALWARDGTLTIHDKTQGSQNVHLYLTMALGMRRADSRVLNSFVGGAFGSGLRPSHTSFLAAMAARHLKRSVRVTLTRAQMFAMTYRPHAVQAIALACDASGKLQSVRHHAICATSTYEDQQEVVVNWSGLAYACDNVQLSYRLAQLDTPTPGDMRAPGAATGMFALECAMDELAAVAGIDPVALRVENFTDRDQNADLPITSKALRECYRDAGARFGWDRRDPVPRSMRDGHELVGWGMAGGAWDAGLALFPTRARATWRTDGRLEIAAAASDIGTGTRTILAEIAADAFGLSARDVVVLLGDSTLPLNPVEGGSWMAASTGAAVAKACDRLKRRIERSALWSHGLRRGAAAGYRDGQLLLTDGGRIPIVDIVANRGASIAKEATVFPPLWSSRKHVSYAHCAVFAEVRVDEDLGVVRITRVVAAIAAGRILNPVTARSQVLGGIVMGIGRSLHEEGMIDHRFGKVMNHSLAEYHIPTHADIHEIDVLFVEERDPLVSPLGVKGLGEIGIVAVAPAIANAVFHATGRRVRDLPITLDKLL